MAHSIVYAPNTKTSSGNNETLIIPTGSDYDYVYSKLLEGNHLANTKSFEQVASAMKYKNMVKPGRYVIGEGMSNKELVGMLRAGAQEAVRYIFVKHRLKEEFAENAANHFEFEKEDLLPLLSDDEYLKKFDFTGERIMSMFIPNSYEIYWNVGAEGFMERMHREYKSFWNKDDRLPKAKKAGLTPVEVSIVASIVEEESVKADERPTIAGLYLNRIKRNMRLEADPTVKFALQDFQIKRLRFKHLDAAASSPYSTYANDGLPPGPICIPSVNSIDAVLNAEDHGYIFMCAKADFSGYHAFARNKSQHDRNAALYRAALSRERIF